MTISLAPADKRSFSLTTHAISQRFQHPDARVLAALVAGTRHPKTIPAERWNDILDATYKHNLASMMLWVVKGGAPELVDGVNWEFLLIATRTQAIQHIWFEHAQQQLHQAFAAAGIQEIWLKGIALAQIAYPQPALRPMNDLDVLVPYEQRYEALKIAQSLGFDFFARPHLTGINLPEWEKDHHYQLMRENNFKIFLEIHYRIIDDSLDAPPAHEAQWQSEQIDRSIPSLPMFKPEAFLLHLCAHALIHHGEAESNLSHFHDIHRLIVSRPINWSLLVDQAIMLRWSYATAHALTTTCYLFDSPIPAHVFTDLESRRLPDENIAHIISLQGRGANLQTVLGVINRLPLKEKIRQLFKYAFPAPSYLRVRYDLAPDTPVWRYYPRRWLHQAGIIRAWIYERLTYRKF